MSDPTAEICAQELKRVSVTIDTEIERFLREEAQGPAERMYNMLRYFMGYADADFKPERSAAGKRFRPGLCLLLAESYGVQDRALEAAVAIELFHNFSLIHDDVEDRDEMRRGRPTVWKLWGVNHAINSGDAQSLLVSKWCLRAAHHPEVGMKLADTLLQTFIKVVEGQYLDFELADAPLSSGTVTEAQYLLMTERKTGALVGVAAEAAGISAGKDAEVCARLREYGTSLGLAFQIADDYRSIWNTKVETGKDAYSDIREHKRTLPFIYAYEQAQGESKRRLGELYSLPRQLTDGEILEAKGIIDATDAQQYVLSYIKKYTTRAQEAAQSVSISEATMALLLDVVELLVPEIA